MFNLFGTSSEIDSNGSSPNLASKTIDTDSQHEKISDVASHPLNQAPPKQPEKGVLGKLSDWFWGTSDNDSTSDKVSSVSTPQLLKQPSGLLRAPSGIITSDDDDDNSDLTTDDDDDDEYFDALDHFEGNLDEQTEPEKKDDVIPVDQKPHKPFSKGFGPPGFSHWNPYGLNKEEAEEFERELEKIHEKRVNETEEFERELEKIHEKRVNETEDDNRGWIGYLASAAAQYLPGAGTVVGNDWARNKIKSFLFGGTDFAALGAEMRKELRILTGDHKLAMATETASKKLTDVVVGNVLKSYPGFTQFIQIESDLVKEIVKALVLKAALNFARNTKSNLGADFDGDLATQIFSDIMKIANETLDQVSGEKFEEIRKIPNINERKKQFRELFKPVSDKFLSIALPNGEADLGLGKLSGSVWNAVANEAIPDLFVKVYELTHKPPHHTEEDLKELERPGGSALKTLAKYIAEKGKDIIPKAVNKNGKDISKEVVSLLTKDPEEALWLEIWLKDRLTDICTTKDPAVKRVWDYAEKNIESIIIHALATLAKSADTSDDTSDKNIVPDVAGAGLKVIEEFLTKNKKTIDKVFEETKNLPEKERNTRLNAQFKPLSDEILFKAGLENNPLVKLVKDQAFPAILRDFYKDMYLYKDDLSPEADALKNHLLDPIAHLKQAPDDLIDEYKAILENPEERMKIVWEKSGIGKVVDELQEACGVFSKDIIRIVKGFTARDKETIAKKLNEGLFKKYPLTEKQQKEFGEGLQAFLGSDNTSLEKTWDYSESIVKAALFKVFAAIAKNQEVEGEADGTKNKNTAIVGNVIHRVLSFLNTKIPVIDAELKKLQSNTEMDKEEKELAIRKLYQPLAKDFLELAGDDLESILPVPTIIRGSLKELLETTLLPAIFHDMYTQLNEGREEAPKHAEELDKVISSGSKFAQTVADYIEGFVPYYMETKPEVVSKIAMKAVDKYVQVLSPEHQDQLGDLITKNVKELGEDPEMAKTSKAISEYSRAMILKVFGGIAKSLNDKESAKDGKGKNHFLLNTSIGFIKLMSDHVKRINQIPPDGRMYPAHIVPHRFMHAGFGDKKHYKTNMLHPALAKDFVKGASQEDKDQQRLQEFFIPFAKDILDIAGVNNPKDLPVPEPLREEVWKLFEGKILPEVLMNVFKEVMKPETLNNIMLKTFDALNEAVDDLAKVEIDDVDGEEEDEQQKVLNEALGTLIKEMVELVPDFWTMTVFNSEKIKNMTAASVGKIVRRKLDDTTMIELINKGLSNFTMPEPGADRGKTDAQKAKENKRVEKELNQKMTSYISRQAKEKFKDFIKSKWDNFHDSFDKGVEKHLGKPGLAVKHFFDDILHFIFFDILGPVFDFIVFKVLWFFVDMKIAEKSKEIIKDIHMPIHENLIYNLCGEWTKSMKGQQEVEETKTQLIEAFEQKRKEEEEAARILEEKRIQEEKKAQEEAQKLADVELLKQQLKSSQVISV